MKRYQILIDLVILGSLTPALPGQQANAQSKAPSYLFYSSRAERQEVEQLRELLEEDMKHRFATADTIEELLKSEADVLILDMPDRIRERDERLTEKIKRTKVIGIGYGVAQMYGDIGLEIHGGACAHTSRTPTAVFLPSKTFPDIKRPQPVAPHEGRGPDTFAMYIPRGSHLTGVVDVIARWDGDSNYAPIVRQGNYVLVGYTAPVATWSEDFKSQFGEIASAVCDAPADKDATAKWPHTMPGTHEFELAAGRSTDALFSKSLYFQFDKPTQLSVRLTHIGSKSMMLLFAQDKGRLHWTRKDAKSGQPLEITVRITEEDIAKVGDGYWRLKVTNFDPGGPASCSLEISAEKLE